MGVSDGLIFLVCPFTLVNMRVEVIVPAFPALLSQSSVELPGYMAPFLRPVHLYKSLLIKMGIELRFGQM